MASQEKSGTFIFPTMGDYGCGSPILVLVLFSPLLVLLHMVLQHIRGVCIGLVRDLLGLVRDLLGFV